MEGPANALPAPVYGNPPSSTPAPPPADDDSTPAEPAYSYEPLPRQVYYAPSPIVYAAPVIGFGIGYYGAYGYGGRHWR